MIIRLLILLVLLGGTGAAIWYGVGSRATSPTERMQRIGLALAAVGAVLTAFAWWLVVPEIILALGLVLLSLSFVKRRSSSAAS